jgi:hypothetical protein
VQAGTPSGSDRARSVDPATNQLWVWLLVSKKLQRFGPASDPSPMPRDAATLLSNIKDG